MCMIDTQVGEKNTYNICYMYKHKVEVFQQMYSVM